MFDLNGRTALVTGASGGIGSAIAKALSEAGAKVALSGTREGVLEEVKATLSGESAIVTANLSDADSVDGLVGRAEEALGGGLDILVANAGITRDKLQELKAQDPHLETRCFMGHSGWSPQQLEREIQNHGWMLSAMRFDLLRQHQGVDLWKEITCEINPDLRVEVEAPDDPSRN